MKKVILLLAIMAITILMVIVRPQKPQLIQPENYEVLSDSTAVISWQYPGKCDLWVVVGHSATILRNFENKATLKNLLPGEYAWFLKCGGQKSQARFFTVKSVVALNVSLKDKSLELKNIGNTDLDLEIRSAKVTGAYLLSLGDELSLKKAQYNITARQK